MAVIVLETGSFSIPAFSSQNNWHWRDCCISSILSLVNNLVIVLYFVAMTAVNYGEPVVGISGTTPLPCSWYTAATISNTARTVTENYTLRHWNKSRFVLQLLHHQYFADICLGNIFVNLTVNRYHSWLYFTINSCIVQGNVGNEQTRGIAISTRYPAC